ncbi:MAG: hypothetical protein WBN09_15745, partial [Woeseiaceae bacterium]
LGVPNFDSTLLWVIPRAGRAVSDAAMPSILRVSALANPARLDARTISVNVRKVFMSEPLPGALHRL